MIEKHLNRPKMEKKLVCRGGGFSVFDLYGFWCDLETRWLAEQESSLAGRWLGTGRLLLSTIFSSNLHKGCEEPTKFKSFSLSNLYLTHKITHSKNWFLETADHFQFCLGLIRQCAMTGNRSMLPMMTVWLTGFIWDLDGVGAAAEDKGKLMRCPLSHHS